MNEEDYSLTFKELKLILLDLKLGWILKQVEQTIVAGKLIEIKGWQ